MKVKIKIESYFGKVLFEAEKEDYTLKLALQDAVLQGAVLRGAVLRGADLRDADLRGAVLRGVDFDKLPQDYINQCSRDMLFIFQCLKSELPAFRDKLIAGKINGSQYQGECACLVGTMANLKNTDVDKVCSAIPFYEKGTHNMGESWFLAIKKGDTPENSGFSKHVLALVDMVLAQK